MKTSGTNRPATFIHALMLARYNLPLYIFATISFMLGLAAACFSGFPFGIRMIGAIVGVVAFWYASASFFAFNLMFDRSNLLSGKWLSAFISDTPHHWTQISIFLEETTLPLGKLFPNAESRSFDLFDSKVTTEPAITRARESAAESGATSESGATAVPADALPAADDWSDLTVVMLAAHEIRDHICREKLFGELHRITSSGGTVILIEHLRNFAAFSAFGPIGFLHFYPRKEWIRLAKLANLKLQRELSITPFVHVFAFTPQSKISDNHVLLTNVNRQQKTKGKRP